MTWLATKTTAIVTSGAVSALAVGDGGDEPARRHGDGGRQRAAQHEADPPHARPGRARPGAGRAKNAHSWRARSRAITAPAPSGRPSDATSMTPSMPVAAVMAPSWTGVRARLVRMGAGPSEDPSCRAQVPTTARRGSPSSPAATTASGRRRRSPWRRRASTSSSRTCASPIRPTRARPPEYGAAAARDADEVLAAIEPLPGPRRGRRGRPPRRRRGRRGSSTPPSAQLGPVSILVNNASGWVADTFAPDRPTASACRSWSRRRPSPATSASTPAPPRC